jgi:hypothetical protein
MHGWEYLARQVEGTASPMPPVFGRGLSLPVCVPMGMTLFFRTFFFPRALLCCWICRRKLGMRRSRAQRIAVFKLFRVYKVMKMQ